jgi:SAM-dependent methyltransferase
MEPLHWLQGQGEPLAFANSSFDLIFSVDVIHHLHDVPGFYREVSRTLRPDGLLCTVTDSADIIHQREVLSGYFPGTVAIELARYPRVSQLEEWMERAGLRDLATVTVEDRYEITNAQPFRDRAFSSLHLIPEDAWRAGLDRLEHDLARGPISGASRYVCVWGRMPRELASGRWR